MRLVTMLPVLNSQQLEFLYGEMRWDEIGRQVDMPAIYGAFQREHLLKVHLLPYLLQIASERQLATELGEREFLGSLCGFRLVERKPSRSTLYFFRNCNPPAFQKAMWFLLLEAALLCRRFELPVPYVEWHKDKPLSIEVSSDTTLFNPYPSFWNDRDVAAILASVPPPNPLVGQLKLPYVGLDGQPLVIAPKPNPLRARLHEAIGLPTSCCVHFLDGTILGLTLQAPSWLLRRSASSNLTFLGPSHIRQEYTTCNVIVLSADRRQILLHEKRSGFGAGTYALPGGKMQRDDKTLADCARRELHEETGLRLKRSRPISNRHHHYSGKLKVQNIGVVCLEWEGQIRLPPGWFDGPWEWFRLDDLPQPLFEPSHHVINDYLNNSYPSLRWNDIEEQLSLFNNDEVIMV